MGDSTAEFARSVVAAWGEREGFEATQTIRADDLEVTARVRWRHPDRVAVEYRTYRHPLLDLEEELVGGAEYTPEELAGMSLRYDGHEAWIIEPGGRTVIVRRGRALFEPLIGIDAIAELTFLRDLTRDFLVRDAGSDGEGGREIRRLDLKPRSAHRSCLVKSVTFIVRSLRIAFDVATGFPTRLDLMLRPTAPALALVPRSGQVTIEYTDVRLSVPGDSAFGEPPATEGRVFSERRIAGTDAEKMLPFRLSLDPLFTRGYVVGDGGAIAAVDASEERGYCTVVAHREAETDSAAVVTLRAGNYLSRNMNRRRARIAEDGAAISIGGTAGRRLDRGARWPEEIRRDERPLVEFAWERKGVHAFLLGDGTDEAELMALSEELADGLGVQDGPEGQRGGPSP